MDLRGVDFDCDPVADFRASHRFPTLLGRSKRFCPGISRPGGPNVASGFERYFLQRLPHERLG